MAYRALPSQEVLRQLLDFDLDAGLVFWRERPSSMFCAGSTSPQAVAKVWNKRYAGKSALKAGGIGYLQVKVFGRAYYAHRVIWALAHGAVSQEMQVDHINGDKNDNRLANLRLVTCSENLRNMPKSKKNASGVVGVQRDREKWAARIQVNGKRIHLGQFATIEAAVQARKVAEVKYGFHQNHGR